ncbi:MAG: M20/M25/M40 family metallo-hydrolase [Candidatus Heimdallarchaeota archaeon]|nr:M20/M25/M40 family metallo-hydrolase [Candidatus Heimdallarchaeota archaeon]
MQIRHFYVENVISFLTKLVNYDTRTNVNSPGKEVKQLLDEELIPRFKKYGFETEIFESNGHYSLLATRVGASPVVLFSGHVDVVPWDDRWDTNPKEVVVSIEQGEEIVKGRGVSDMKSGIAALMLALPEIAKSDLGIYFAITGDEEIGGEDGTKIIVDHLINENKLPEYVITADAAGMEIITRRRNAFDIFVKSKKTMKTIVGKKEKRTFYSKIVSAATSHAAYFKKKQDIHCLKDASNFLKTNGYLPISLKGKFVKINVIPNEIELEYIIPQDEGEELQYDLGLQAVVEFAGKVMDISFETLAHSDYDINSTANVLNNNENEWLLEVDIRAMLDYAAEELEGSILLIRDSINWDLDIEIQKSVGFIATPDDNPLVKGTTQILKELGYPYSTAERGGATDGRFFAQHSIPTIDIGAIGWNVHGPNETATTKSIKDLVTFFERSLHEIKKEY